MPVSLTMPNRANARDIASARVAFHVMDRVSVRVIYIFAARWLAYAYPCQRFAATLTGDDSGPLWFAIPSV
jgi:hypothetical protein